MGTGGEKSEKKDGLLINQLHHNNYAIIKTLPPASPQVDRVNKQERERAQTWQEKGEVWEKTGKGSIVIPKILVMPMLGQMLHALFWSTAILDLEKKRVSC